mmetsp:Transcript_10498/g.25958  ORF Transcript_10498/g.25958 Transcript_10498/m.25958 type:complete len:310 (+) Transcript_10498:453-1382(+)
MTACATSRSLRAMPCPESLPRGSPLTFFLQKSAQSLAICARPVLRRSVAVIRNCAASALGPCGCCLTKSRNLRRRLPALAVAGELLLHVDVEAGEEHVLERDLGVLAQGLVHEARAPLEEAALGGGLQGGRVVVHGGHGEELHAVVLAGSARQQQQLHPKGEACHAREQQLRDGCALDRFRRGLAPGVRRQPDAGGDTEGGCRRCRFRPGGFGVDDRASPSLEVLHDHGERHRLRLVVRGGQQHEGRLAKLRGPRAAGDRRPPVAARLHAVHEDGVDAAEAQRAPDRRVVGHEHLFVGDDEAGRRGWGG